MLREHVLRKPPEKAQMIVEIWAESGRNARVAEFTRQLDRDVIEGMVELVDLAKAKRRAAATLDFALRRAACCSRWSRAVQAQGVEPAFDLEAEFAMAIGVFEALFTGALAPRVEV